MYQIWVHLAEPFRSYNTVTMSIILHAERATRQANPLEGMGTAKNIID